MNPSVLFVFILSILLGVLRAADLAFGTDAVTGLCVVGSVWWRYLALGIVVLAAVLVGRTQPSRSEAVRSRRPLAGILAFVGAVCFLAAKIALGYTLDQIGEKSTPNSAYEAPQLDYLICKIPRWDLTKFAGVSRQIGSSMKSVGEIMSIGRSFEEIIQKGLRMIGQGMHGFV